MTVQFSNNASTTLAATMNTAATSMTVATGTGALFPTPAGGSYFYTTLVNAANAIEIVKCTARVSDTLTIVRAQDGTTALSYNIGDKVELRVTAGALSDIQSQPIGTTQLTDGSVTNPKLADSSVGASKLADGAATTAKIPDANVTAAKLASGAALANLGFTPVQQGGGTGQGAEKLYVGWNATAGLTVQVDSTLYRAMTERPEAYANSGGYRGMPQTVFTGSATFGLTQLGGHLYHSDGVASTVTVPADSSFTSTPDPGSVVVIINGPGAAAVSITPAGGVTLFWAGTALSGARSLAAQGEASIVRVAANTWAISGVGLT